jgi:uncharacterized membrane protein
LILPWVRAFYPKNTLLSVAWVANLAAIVIAVGIYPPISLYNRMHLCSNFSRPTLRGTAYLDTMNPQDAKALAWLNENLTRNDIVLEAPGIQGYNCFDTRVAIFTGSPTLIGWGGEEEQMRYNNALTDSRKQDADLIFGTPDPAAAQRLLERYQVQYVYVGANERKVYSALGLEKFRQFMDPVYDRDGVTIYRRRF